MKRELSRYYEKHNERYAPGLSPKEMDGLTTGEIAPMFGKTGGGMQHDMPFTMKELKVLKLIKDVKMMW